MRLQKSILLFFLFLSVGIFSFSSDAFASTSTPVVDDIFENTTWNLTGSPYAVQDDIMVASGVTLTIEPGVIVKVAPFAGIYVLGSLSAEGTSDNHIYFTSLWNDSIGGDTNGDGNKTVPIVGQWNSKGLWRGVYFYTPEGVSLDNADISFSMFGFDFWATDASISNIKGRNNQIDLSINANSNINLSGGDLFGELYYGIQMFESTLVADHITIDGTQNYEAIQTENSDLTLTDSTIQNLENYTEAIGAEGPGTINWERVTTLNANRVVGYTGIIFNIKDSTLDQSDIQTWGDSTFNIENSTLQNAWHAIDDYGGDTFNITKSKIINNRGSGIYLSSDTRSPDSIFNISDTTISGNAQYGVYNRASYPINLENVWWGDASGPRHETLNPTGLGNAVSDNVLFDPWCKDETCKSGFSNVLFLPGIEASRLYTSRADGSEDQLWEPNVNTDVEDLYLNSDGTSINPNIYTRDIIKETNTPIPTGPAGQNMYKSFANTMNDLVDNFKIADWKPFAYDWRQSVDDIVNNGTKYQDGTISLVDTLQSLVDSSKNGKVTIIAHSNGGLLAKALLKKLQDDKTAGVNNLIDSVDVLILVAVPEIGTASAVPAILHGYDQQIAGGWLMDNTRAREFGRNMLGAYGLLPSEAYIDHVSASPVTFVDNLIPSGVTTKLVQYFGSAISLYPKYKDFLLGAEGRTNPLPIQTNLPIKLSSSLFVQAENLHKNIDSWVPPILPAPLTSMRVIEVAGWGLDTVASFEYYPKLGDCTASSGVCASYVLDERPRFTSDGDKIVVVPSAQYMSSINSSVEKYWVNLFQINNDKFPLTPNKEHANIFEVTPVLSFLSNVIQNNNEIDPIYFSTTTPVDPKNRFRISVHSPVTLDAYDYNIKPNHTGKICPPTPAFCYVEENIINSSYLEFGEGKYLNLPEDQMFKVKLQGTDVGTFTYDSEKVSLSPDETSITSSFVDIPVTTQTRAEITLNQAGTPQLALYVNGGEVADFIISPNATFDPILYLQIIKATVDSLDLPQAKIIVFNNRIDNIIKSIQKGKIDQAKLKAEKFTRIFTNTLSKTDPKNPKPHKLSKTDAQILLDILNKLLDNLN